MKIASIEISGVKTKLYRILKADMMQPQTSYLTLYSCIDFFFF